MMCQGCGAAMKLAPSRDHFLCEYCGAHRFPERSEDGIEILGILTQHPCPTCGRLLVQGRLEGAEVEHCTHCEGFLIGQRDFGSVLTVRRAWTRRDPPPPRAITPEQMARSIQCPRCGQTMYVEPYLGPGCQVLDTCLTCEQVWLDRDELSTLARS